MKRKNLIFGSLLASALLFNYSVFGQCKRQQSSTGQADGVCTITTSVPILTVSPDARSAALGDAGVALSPDANTPHWNPAKLGFVPYDASVGISYSPWLRNIIPDMSLSYLSGYKKVSENSAFSASLLYFDLGEIQFTDRNGLPVTDFNPKEYTFDLAYGQKLSDNLALGVGARFIHSNLSSGVNDAKAANSGAVDVGIYYTNDLEMGGKNYNLSFGGNISNIGGKITYTTPDKKDFLPTNLRLGTAITTELDPFNKLTLVFDANKLLVPSPQDDATGTQPDDSVIKGIFKSFGDAPGGFKEELQEINLSTGLEYWYNELFAARAGYFYENKFKGDRQYLSLGLGLRYQKFGLDAAYLIPNERNNPLSNTIRFSLFFNLDGKEQQ